jgi:hypothetical protein
VIFSRDAVLSHLVLVETASEALAAVMEERNEGNILRQREGSQTRGCRRHLGVYNSLLGIDIIFFASKVSLRRAAPFYH